MLRLFAFAGLALTMLGAPAALAQNATFFTVTYVEVGPRMARSAVPALRAYRDAGGKDAGNVAFEVLQRIDRPNQFAVLGAWTDPKAFEAHAGGAAQKAMNEKLARMLAAPNDTRQHNGLSVAPGKTARGAVYAVTHVDVIPPQKDNGVNAVKALAEESRKHAGNLRFDVWQQTNRPNHFTVVEAWSSRGAFDVHIVQKETTDFRTKLAVMTGALYDERLYKALR
jgi:quinol monooxygenase YgiN